MVPEGWHLTELKSLSLKISVGLAISVTQHMRPSGVKLIRNQNIKRNIFDPSSLVYVSLSFAEKNESKRVKAGDVIAVRTGSNIGMACVVPDEFQDALTFTTLIVRPDERLLNPIYLALHINSQRGLAEVARLSAGGGKLNLNSGALKRYRILTPPLPEQKKIAQILATWDKAIATTEQLLANSQQQKKALMQQLLTGKKRLLDENRKPFSGEWSKFKLGELGNFYSGLSGKKKDDFGHGSEFITYMNVFKNSRIKSSAHGLVKIGKNENQNMVKYGDIFFTTSSETIQEVGMAAVFLDHDIDVYLNSFCFGFRLHNFELLIPDFARYYLRSSATRSKIAKLGQGATRYNLPRKELIKLELNLPDKNEQLAIADVLTKTDVEIGLIADRLSSLKTEKKALMQQLLTGKRRVKVDQEVA